MAAVAPLIGLLGTVWGIMRAFHDMAQVGSAAPSVVAGGVAEALLTTAAGLVGFAIGTETLGSIVSPCMRCGATGLRPTFSRVSDQ